jgi:hypothetical protein
MISAAGQQESDVSFWALLLAQSFFTTTQPSGDGFCPGGATFACTTDRLSRQSSSHLQLQALRFECTPGT